MTKFWPTTSGSWRIENWKTYSFATMFIVYDYNRPHPLPLSWYRHFLWVV